MGPSTMIAAYVRVSSRQQDVKTQKAAILQAATARGDVIERWFQEKTSAKTIARPELWTLREAVRRGEFRKCYVFKIDRLSRSGIRDTLQVVEEFRTHGCKLQPVADGFELEGPTGDVVLAVLAWAAQMERQAMGDRISAARARVEAAGGNWGRPRRVGPITLERARVMRDQGASVRDISVALKIKKSTLYGALSGKGGYANVERPGIK